ncbi:ribonuclease Y [Oceanotoga sp. DSM 15011]|jgi:ribonuclease Y|uniref:Ribonuclease Y n=3 Tax=Bacteria TaxID=2 RepID=A0AA45C7I1_9BACT|nr:MULTISPECIES: ribonuclease Y [Oceanotoga]MDN5342167.1 ribonucrease [Oceanotoga sp.]MDO7976206.1 ribonuclease Y [Oceanotoga teriensis]PWJ95403.1 ribonuclease Y [Oceanotoga teriensis]UYP01042.1 ribonuclease Y [Oceanotoga sp. DSM 15011]
MLVIQIIITLIIAIITLFIGLYMGNSKFISTLKTKKEELEEDIAKARVEAAKIREKALEEASAIKKKEIVEAREEVHKLRQSFDSEVKQQKEDLKNQEERLIRKEENIDRKDQNIEKLKEKLETEKTEIEEIKTQAKEKLNEIANLSENEAKEIVMNEVKEKYESDLALKFKEIKDQYEEDAKKYAKWVITTSIQRYASDITSEITTSTVVLPTDDMKGRIIGREGRNIRTFEKLTGTDLIIDDTPEIVVLSCFNPLRREIAKRSLEMLVADGRIHPARIEEMYEKSKKEVEEYIKEAGKEAVMRVGIKPPHSELVKLLGRLKFRTSYGQDVLEHSIEVAQFAGLMASELGLNVELAKRAALFHDIGKAIDHEVEGSHAVVGGQIAKRYNEKIEVVNGIQYHHNEVDAMTPEAVLVGAADALSAARPGARRETLENYVRRIEQLEEIAKSFRYVDKAYAIQAGRELRIIVQPDKIEDAMAEKLAQDISIQIEEKMQYPGVIKVTVIREKRSVSYAS